MTAQLPRSFSRSHLYIPLVIFIAFAMSIELSSLTACLADELYIFEDGHYLWTLGICGFFSLILFKLILVGKTAPH